MSGTALLPRTFAARPSHAIRVAGFDGVGDVEQPDGILARERKGGRPVAGHAQSSITADTAPATRGRPAVVSRPAEIVYRLRTNAGLSQTELARLLGTTQPAIARVEAGGSTPHTLDLLDRVGRAVDVEIALTLSGETVHFGSTAA